MLLCYEYRDSLHLLEGNFHCYDSGMDVAVVVPSFFFLRSFGRSVVPSSLVSEVSPKQRMGWTLNLENGHF